jgi:hypothetical protein
MTRNENDLRNALRDLEQRADQQGAPSTAAILGATTVSRHDRDSISHRSRRWLPPLAAAAVVATAAITAAAISSQHGGSPHSGQAGGAPTDNPSATQPVAPPPSPATTTEASSKADPATNAATILDEAAAKLDTAPAWTAPHPQDFFYIRTTDATTWTSVSGRQPGDGTAADGGKIWVPGCDNGKIVSDGESGTCTLNDVPHYLVDAPTSPNGWDAYLEQIAPGSRAADAQGKIIVQVLHQDLVAPEAAAALLRYTASCPGLHTLDLHPVDGESLVGVTCTSMTNGSYSLAFDATSHVFVGYAVLSGDRQDGPAEIIRTTGIVSAVGRTP